MNSKKPYLILANITVFIHGAVVLINIAGVIGIIFNKLPLLHNIGFFGILFLVCFILTLLSCIIYKACLFTVWENKLRGQYDPALVYKVSCLERYLPFIPIVVINNSVKILFIAAVGAMLYWQVIQ